MCPSWEISIKFLFLLNHFPKISLLSLPHNIFYQPSIYLSLIFSYNIGICFLITVCVKGLAGYMLLLSCFKICLTEFDGFYQGQKFINRVRECLVTNSIFLHHHHHFFMPFYSRIKCYLQYLSYYMCHITSTTASLYATGTYVIRIIIFTFLFKISILMLQSNLSTLLNMSHFHLYCDYLFSQHPIWTLI